MAKKRKIGIVATATAAVATTAMLVGATYAWFTDSVTSKDNIIQAGTLDITLEHSDSPLGVNDDGWTDASSGAIFNHNNWEPGYVSVKYVKIENEGTLDFKFKLDIVPNATAADVDLADVIEVYMFDDAVTVSRSDLTTEGAAYVGTLSEMMKDPDGAAYGVLYADETKGNTYEIYGIALKMSEEAGNEYMGKIVGGGFAVQLFAAQLASEIDSIDGSYDEGAGYESIVSDASDLALALKEGGNIALANDITVENGFLLEDSKDTVLNLNGHTLTTTGERAKLFSIGGDADFTIYGGKLVAESTNGGPNGTSTGASTSMYFWSSGNLTMTDVEIEGSVRGGHRAIDVYSGNAVLTNVDITTSYGSGVNAGSGDAANTPAVVTLKDCDITVNGMYNAPYNSVCFSVMGGGEMTIESGNYTMKNDATYATGNTHGGWVGIVMNSGGVLNINGGTYTNVPTDGFLPQYERAIINADASTAIVNIKGGIFDPQEKALFAGTGKLNGQFIDNNDGTYTGSKQVVPDGTTFVSEGLYVDADGVYYITKAAGFDGMREMVADEAVSDKDGTWILYNDIDLNGINWTPIAGFYGTFDGKGKTISNMSASFLAENTYANEDFHVECIIKNVTFHKANVTGTEYVGVVVGRGTGVTVENVKVTESTVIGTKYVGGIVGAVNKAVSTITGCTVTGCTIKADGENANGKVGGIVGFLSVGKATGNTVTGCTISGPECVGGIAGRGGSGDGPATIYGNTVSGNTVTGTKTTTVGEQIGDKLNVKESE